MAPLKRICLRCVSDTRRRIHRGAANTEPWVHAGYMALVFLEGHGLYAILGGVGAVVILIVLVTGLGAEL